MNTRNLYRCPAGHLRVTYTTIDASQESATQPVELPCIHHGERGMQCDGSAAFVESRIVTKQITDVCQRFQDVQVDVAHHVRCLIPHADSELLVVKQTDGTYAFMHQSRVAAMQLLADKQIVVQVECGGRTERLLCESVESPEKVAQLIVSAIRPFDFRDWQAKVTELLDRSFRSEAFGDALQAEWRFGSEYSVRAKPGWEDVNLYFSDGTNQRVRIEETGLVVNMILNWLQAARSV